MNDTLTTIHSLRTVHGTFSARDVLEDDLSTVLQAATRAANSSARQPYSVVVIDDRDRMDAIIGYRASRALVFCIDFHRLEALAARLGHEFDNTDVIGFVTASVDVVLAAQTAVIAAKSLGIDSLITNGIHRRPLDRVQAELGLPGSSVFPLIAVLLGYPEGDVGPQRDRLPSRFVTHREHYRDPTPAELDEIIAAYDAPDLHLGMAGWDPRSHPHYLDWFFREWCPPAPTDRVPTGKVREFQERLVRSGFWWTQG